jgi:microcompartment protein CcmK/EutM
VGERVLVVVEGRAAGQAIGRTLAAVDAAIVGIIDHVDISQDL